VTASTEADPDIRLFLPMMIVQPPDPEFVKRPSTEGIGRAPLPAVLLRSLRVRLGELTRPRTVLSRLNPIPQVSISVRLDEFSQL
jgi:hypothetical protein